MAAVLLLGVEALPAATDYRLELQRSSLSGDHCRYREYVDGIPTENYVTRSCDGRPLSASMLRTAKTDGLRRVNGRVVRRRVIEERPLEPFGVDVDVATGEVIQRVPLFFRGKPAQIFDPNPVVSLNDPALQDRNDASSAVPAGAYRTIEIDSIAASGPLRNASATIVDRQLPAANPADAAGPLAFDRSESGFQDVNAFVHVDRNQRWLQSLGYVGSRQLVPYSIEIDAHAANGTDNSYFLPDANAIARGTLYFGEGGTDDAEDADLIVHEYGHAILEWISPGTFGGTFASESRALAEGFGDYWAFSAHYAQRTASGRDPYCFADWDARCWEDDASQLCGYQAGTDCLRRLDGALTMADFETGSNAGVEHRNGAIWSSALREMHQALVAAEGLDRGRAIADTLVIESAFGAPPHPTYAVMAARMVEADRLLFGGAHANLICAVMASRQIASTCDLRPQGDLTLLPSSDSGVAIPENDPTGVVSTLVVVDARTIEKLYVQIDIDHPTRGDLRIDLIGPDGTTAMLQQVSFERGPGIRTTFGLTAMPSDPLNVFEGKTARGAWQLVVRDLRARDTGTLRSWGLVIRFAGDVPLQTRPTGEHRQTIPVVAHLYGANDTTFRSDLRIANAGATGETATLVFTPSGADGTTDFFAMRLALAAGQTIALDDVVDSLFHTTASGSLEVIGQVLVASRTHTPAAGGAVGQQVPPAVESAARSDAPILVVPFVGERPSRLNVGITEIAGEAGVALLSVRGGSELRIELAPFTHLQVSMPTLAPVSIAVESGEARIVGYGSQIDEASDDPMYLPAVRAKGGVWIAPVIRAEGIGAFWRSDLWMQAEGTQTAAVALTLLEEGSRATIARSIAPAERAIHEDAVETLFGSERRFGALVVQSEEPLLPQSRVVTDGMSQFIPFAPPGGADQQQLLFVESSEPYRTNVGIVAAGPAEAEVTVHDAAGNVVERFLLMTAGGAAQRGVATPVTSGRAMVRFLSGTGRAYASLIDNRSGDATWIDSSP